MISCWAARTLLYFRETSQVLQGILYSVCSLLACLFVLCSPSQIYADLFDNGAGFLTSHQQPNGSWTSIEVRQTQVTAEVVWTLQQLSAGNAVRTAAVNFLNTTPVEDTDGLSRRILILAGQGSDVSILVADVLAASSPRGGWGLTAEFSADPLDTALALTAIAAVGAVGGDVITKALTSIIASQNTDGGWSCVAGGDSNVPCTATVLTALAAYRQQFLLESALLAARRFLLTYVDANGSIIDATADPIYTTALAVYALVKAGDDLGDDQSAVRSFLQNTQNTDGSWGEDPLFTAVALRALDAMLHIPMCGDGAANQRTEQCDGTDFRELTCEAVGGVGVLKCRSDCTVDISECTAPPFCGDGIRNQGTEVCDGVDFGGATCQTLGFRGGSLICATDCSGIDTTGCNSLTPGIPDGDGDGFSADIDCDDSNPDIHPGQAEVLFNSRDDDCDDHTPDKSFGLTANFVTTPAIGTPGAPLQFKDKSYPFTIVVWEWDFNNDGVVDSTQQNPLYTFATPGIFHVSLRITDTIGNTASLLKTVPVADPTGNNGINPFNHKGTEFIIPSPGTGSDMELLLISETPTEATVEYPMNSPEFTMTVAVRPGEATVVKLPAIQPRAVPSDIPILDFAIRVSAPDEITCYIAERNPFSTSSDSALALPVDELGTEYMLAVHPKAVIGNAHVVAAFDHTTVTIEAPFPIDPVFPILVGGSQPVPSSFTLNRGEWVQLETGAAQFPMTGVRLIADRPISVFEDSSTVYLALDTCCADQAFEVAQPVAAWGKEIFVANLPNRPDGSRYVIVAAEANTTVTQDGNVLGTINRGGYFAIPPLPGNHIFAADKPIFVTQFMTGAGAAPGGDGDHSVVNMVPPEQYRPTYTFATVGGEQFTNHFATVIAQNRDVACGTIYLDGTPLAADAFTPIGGSDFSAAVIPLSVGTHTTSSNGVHYVTVGGTVEAGSYLHPAGPGGPVVNSRGDTNPPLCTISLNQGLPQFVNGTAEDSRLREDVNENCVLDPAEDQNSNGKLDADTGIASVELTAGADNLRLTSEPFAFGDPKVSFHIHLADPSQSGSGTLLVTDGAGNPCTAVIALESSPSPPRCGDGVVNQANEECDLVDLNGASCVSLGLPPGTLQCGANCRFETTGCNGLVIDVPRDADGDGFHADEDCDDTNPNVHPGATEILGNGSDDDCNPGTPDAVDSAELSCTVTTDKISYGARENVRADVVVRRSGGTGSIVGLQLAMKAEHESGLSLGVSSDALAALGPGERQERSFFFPTGITPPGRFTVSAEVLADTEAIISCSAEALIASSTQQGLNLAGSIEADPAVAAVGEAVTLRYSVRNAGNVALDSVQIEILLVNPDTGSVLATLTDSAQLVPNAVHTAVQAAPPSLPAGTYVIILRAGNSTETLASLASDSLLLQGGATNLSPIANAGLDQTVGPGQEVHLDGRSSNDPDSGPSPLTFQWRFSSKPNSSTLTDASISGAATAQATFLPDVLGDYMLRLTVSDGALSAMDEVLVRVQNTPPVADAGLDRNVQTGKPATLNGSESFDPNGDLITYQWSLDSKPAASTLTMASILGRTTPNPSFIPDVDGRYVFKLIVNDGQADSTPDTVELTASASNVPPNANAGSDRTVLVGTQVVLDGRASEDADNGPSPLTYLWTFAQVPVGSALQDASILTATQAQASFVPDVVGTYVLKLRVSDGQASDEDTVVFTAGTLDVPPNADAGADQTVTLGSEVILDGRGSSDPDSGPQPLSFNWRLVAVPADSAVRNVSIQEATTATPRFTPDVMGSYVLEVEVFDGVVSDFDNVLVIVTCVKAVTASPNVLWPPNHKMVPVTVAASVSNQCNAAPVCQISSVSSDEPINGLGDGDTAPDWQITGNLTLKLRAERSGNGKGRVYTITVSCIEETGYPVIKTTTVSVPHDQGNKK